MEIFKSFTFEAAHRLPYVQADHKCARLHGHSFHVTIHVEDAIGEDTGWVMDFAVLKERCKPVIDALDHRYLNEIDGLDNPTSENIARWLWRYLQPGLPQLSKIVVRETCTSGCIYRGD
jgi:6-pyruvoyltetrahydropterin/6-carboxytetrahydropterin synthase